MRQSHRYARLRALQQNIRTKQFYQATPQQQGEVRKASGGKRDDEDRTGIYNLARDVCSTLAHQNCKRHHFKRPRPSSTSIEAHGSPRRLATLEGNAAWSDFAATAHSSMYSSEGPHSSQQRDCNLSIAVVSCASEIQVGIACPTLEQENRIWLTRSLRHVREEGA